MAAAAGKRKTKAPSLPSGFVYDLPSLNRPPYSAPGAGISLQDDYTPPRVSPPPSVGNSSDLELLKLQIEKQRLEIQVLELEAQAKARSLSSPGSGKPADIPSLETVRSGTNSGKSQGQLDHNTRITKPQEWPHLHVPFGLARKKFKDLTTSEFVYGYLDIVNSEPPEKQAVMTRHLMSLMRLASKYNWPSVLSFHAAVLDRIEAGLANWGDDFSEIERFNITESQRLPNTQSPANIASVPGQLTTAHAHIAAIGIALARATTPVISREWSIPALIVNFPITPSPPALLDHLRPQLVPRPLRLIDYAPRSLLAKLLYLQSQHLIR